LIHPLLHWDGVPGSFLPVVVNLAYGVVEEVGNDEELRFVLLDDSEQLLAGDVIKHMF